MRRLGPDCPSAVLCGASDGDDGNSGSSGAVVDASTYSSLHIRNFPLEFLDGFLERSNVFPLLEALGATLSGMDTQCNLNDLVIVVSPVHNHERATPASSPKSRHEEQPYDEMAGVN